MQFNLFVVNDYCHRVFGINRSFLKLHQHFVNYNQESIKGREIAREQAFNRAFFCPNREPVHRLGQRMHPSYTPYSIGNSSRFIFKTTDPKGD